MSTRVCSLLKDRYLLTLVLADAAFAETLHETGHYVHYRLLVTSFLHVGRSVHRTTCRQITASKLKLTDPDRR
jgi:hypothetical protein